MSEWGCVVWEKEKRERGEEICCNDEKTKEKCFNIYTYSASEREEGTGSGSVSQDSRKKRKQRGEKGNLRERESQRWTEASEQFTGLKCAATNLQGRRRREKSETD